jgi:hypothetical protein
MCVRAVGRDAPKGPPGWEAAPRRMGCAGTAADRRRGSPRPRRRAATRPDHANHSRRNLGSGRPSIGQRTLPSRTRISATIVKPTVAPQSGPDPILADSASRRRAIRHERHRWNARVSTYRARRRSRWWLCKLGCLGPGKPVVVPRGRAVSLPCKPRIPGPPAPYPNCTWYTGNICDTPGTGAPVHDQKGTLREGPGVPDIRP